MFEGFFAWVIVWYRIRSSSCGLIGCCLGGLIVC